MNKLPKCDAVCKTAPWSVWFCFCWIIHFFRGKNRFTISVTSNLVCVKVGRLYAVYSSTHLHQQVVPSKPRKCSVRWTEDWWLLRCRQKQLKFAPSGFLPSNLSHRTALPITQYCSKQSHIQRLWMVCKMCTSWFPV